ncbi:MAG: hypothetical protein AB7D06_18555 [Pedobacter sp.]
MLTELAGFTLKRSIPDNTFAGIVTGAYKIYGGVVRDNSGRIVAHLANAANPLNIATAVSSPFNTVLNGINTYQLSRISANVEQLITLAKGTMILSGLTLGVSAIGFIFLNQKLKNFNLRINEIKKEVTEIKNFLALKESSRIFNALKMIEDANKKIKNKLREELLLEARNTVGEINQKYCMQLHEIKSTPEFFLIEEYFTITALAQAMCSAELGLFDHAVDEMQNTYEFWKNSTANIAKKMIIKGNPERLMHPLYLKHATTYQIIDWLDFANKTDLGVNWIDELRENRYNNKTYNIKYMLKHMSPFKKHKNITQKEILELEIMDKIVSRDKVLDGYISQYEYLANIKSKPSTIQNFIEKLPKDESVNDCFIFISDSHLNAA